MAEFFTLRPLLHSFAQTVYDMRKNLFSILTVTAALCSCGLKEFGELPQPVVVPDYIDEPVIPLKTVVVGVEYPDVDYDWNKSSGEAHSANLVVYRDGEPVIRVPVSESGFVSEELDMHRYVGGHLYTDWSTDTHTVISRDGAELFRYPSAERIVLLNEKDGRVLTLGESRSGSGFSSRADGEPLFLGLDGYVFQNAGLSPEGDIRFFYGISVNSTAGPLPEYYAVAGRENIKINLPADAGRIYGFTFPEDRAAGQPASKAAAAFDGITALGRFPDGSGGYDVALYSVDTEETEVLQNSWSSWSSLRTGTVIGNSSPVLSVWVRKSRILGESTNIYCGTERVFLWFVSDIPVGFRVCEDGSVTGVRKTVSADGRDVLYRGEVRDTLPEGYTVMTGDAVCVSNGGAYLGLSSKKGGRALLWKDGEIDTLGFRGIVTAVLRER